LRLWDAGIGAPIGIPLQGHAYGVMSVAFSPDGERIVSTSSDNSLRLWPILRPWAENLCTKLTRNMSRLEWQQWVSTDFDYTCQCPGLPVPPNDPKAGAASETCLTPYAPEPVPLRSTPRT
jgi:WD40 repeat protein